MIRLKIEEDNRNAEKKSRKSSTIIRVNIVEEDPTKDKKRKKSNGQKSEQAKKKFKNFRLNSHRYKRYEDDTVSWWEKVFYNFY